MNAPPTDRPSLAALDRLLADRHSCRGFRPEPVPEPLIRAVLEAAARTASWCNAQPWRVVVTRGDATERLRAAYQAAVADTAPAPDLPFPAEYRGVHLERRRTCGWQLYDAVGVARGDREAARRQSLRNFALFDAPHVAIVTTEAHLGVYGAVDCGGFVTNFMNAATAAGLGCIAQAALASYAAVPRRLFGLPDTQQVVCGIAFGYADPDHPANGFRTGRASPDSFVTWAGEG